MDDNPFAAPQSRPDKLKPRRSLAWHLLFNPFHPISCLVPLAMTGLILLAGLIAYFLNR